MATIGAGRSALEEHRNDLVSADQARLLEELLDVPDGSRFSQLERLHIR